MPLIGFKGNKIDNYEEILFPAQYEFEEVENELMTSMIMIMKNMKK